MAHTLTILRRPPRLCKSREGYLGIASGDEIHRYAVLVCMHGAVHRNDATSALTQLPLLAPKLSLALFIVYPYLLLVD